VTKNSKNSNSKKKKKTHHVHTTKKTHHIHTTHRKRTRNINLLQIDKGAYTCRQRLEAIVADVELPQPIKIKEFLRQ
jgi:hypothetical protein